MIKNKQLWEAFERKQLEKERFSYQEALSIFENLLQEACALGVMPPLNSLEGLETDLRIARAITYF